MSTKHGKTLRLHMPQWQGGNIQDYYFGSKLLAWLAPPADGPVETIPVPEPKPGETLEIENGILGRGALIRQARAAREAISVTGIVSTGPSAGGASQASSFDPR